MCVFTLKDDNKSFQEKTTTTKNIDKKGLKLNSKKAETVVFLKSD